MLLLQFFLDEQKSHIYIRHPSNVLCGNNKLDGTKAKGDLVDSIKMISGLVVVKPKGKPDLI